MSTLPIHASLAVVDIEKFGERTDPDQRWLRDRMYDILATAADDAGIPWDQCHHLDRGDGVALLIPASVSKVTIAEGLVNELNAGLSTHNRRSREPFAMRMRMALHAGEISYDGRTWVGTELNAVCRLIDLPQLRKALADAPLAHLALCVCPICGFEPWSSSIPAESTTVPTDQSLSGPRNSAASPGCTFPISTPLSERRIETQGGGCSDDDPQSAL